MAQRIALSVGVLLCVHLGSGLGPVSIAAAQSTTLPFFGPWFDESLLTDLPSGRSPWAIFETVDPLAVVDRIDGGGLTTGRPALIGVNGSSWAQTSYVWNARDITRPDVPGVPLLYPDFSSFRNVALASALLPVEHRGPGGVVLMTSRPAPSKWSGGAAVGVSPTSPANSSRTRAVTLDRLSGLREVMLHAGGPALRDRLQLSASATRIAMDHFARRDRTLAAAATLATLTSVARLSPRRNVTTTLSFSDTTRDDPWGVDGFRDARSFDVASRVRSAAAIGGSWSLGGSYGRLRLDARRAGRLAPAAADQATEGPLADRLPAAGRRLSVWSVDGTWSRRHGTRQMWRAGASITRADAQTTWLSDRETVGELVDARPARLWTYVAHGPVSRWAAGEIAAYLSDRWTFGDTLDLEAGIRLDVTRARDIHWVQASPRVSARWHLSDAIDVLAGYGRYAHRLALTHLAFGDPAAPSIEVHRWNDYNADRLPQADEAGILISRLGPGSSGLNDSGIDPDLRNPWTDEVVAGFEWSPHDRFSFGVTGIRRRDRDLIAAANVGVDPSDFTVRLMPDPGGDLISSADDQLLPVFDRHPDSFGRDRVVLTNPPDHASFFEALVLKLERRHERWRLLFGAAAVRVVGPAMHRGSGARSNDQSGPGELFLTPNAATFARGRLFFDRAFTVKIAGTARLPWQLRTGVVARYQDGQPFSRLVVVDDLAQGPEAVRAVPNGRHRFQYLTRVDARVARAFVISNGTLTISLDAFNVL
ncbi:MAG: TonB-dependent receptor, partial [Acidobacteria bacterium]|nr:TonB-dependent receptor [Acidobacteriota bacterium]